MSDTKVYQFGTEGNASLNALLPFLQQKGIDPYGEEFQYMSGDIAKRMFPVAKRFMCDCCRKKMLV